MGLSFLRLACVLVLLQLAAATGPLPATAASVESNRFARVADAVDGIRGFPARVVTVETSDGLTLKGLYWPQRDAAKPVIVFFSGWQPPLESVVSQVTPAVRSGYGVIAAIRRGFAGNPGSANEAGYYADGQAYARLARSLAEGGPVILFGYSMGAPVAIEVARREPVTGVVAVGLFTHSEAIGLPLASVFIGDPYDSREAIAGVEEPLVLIYGRDDSLVPVEQGRELFQLASGPRALLVIQEAGHFLRSTSLLPIIDAAIEAIIAGDLSKLHDLPRDSVRVSIAGSTDMATGERSGSRAVETATPDPKPHYSLPAEPSPLPAQPAPTRSPRVPPGDRR